MLFRGRDHPGKVVVRKNATAVGWACVSGAVGEMLTSAVGRQSCEVASQDLGAERPPSHSTSQSPVPSAGTGHNRASVPARIPGMRNSVLQLAISCRSCA